MNLEFEELSIFVNTQQLKKIALKVLNIDQTDSDAANILIWSILKENPDLRDNHDQEKVTQKFLDEMTQYNLTELSQKGLIDYDFITKKYKITKSGKEILTSIKNES